MIDYFYADPHFGHRKILTLACRPFETIAEHDSTLIRKYNERIYSHGTLSLGPCGGPVGWPNVLWLGDCFLTTAKRAQEILGQMRGHKFALVGNHDRSARWLTKLGFTVIDGELLLQLGQHSVRISHYPYACQSPSTHADRTPDRFLEKRPLRRHDEVLIHGHAHTRTRYRDNAVHVGVDAWDYQPVSVNEVIDLLNEHKAK